MEFLTVAVLGLLAIAAAQTVGGRLRLAAPLLLVLVASGSASGFVLTRRPPDVGWAARLGGSY